MANVKAPDAGVYGVFSPTYAATLARKQGGGADALNNLALMMLSQGERQGYGDILQATNEQGLREAEIAAGTDIAKAYLPAIAGMADKGVLGAVQVQNPYVTVDQARANQNDVIAQNAAQQAAFENTASGIKYLTESGVRPPVEDIGAMITPPIQATQSTVQPYVSFDSDTDRIKANASMVSANKPSGGSGSGDSVQLSIADDGFGDPTYTYRGKDPNAVRQAYEQGGGGPRGPRGAGNGGRPVADVKAQVGQAKARGATAQAVGRDTVVLTFPNGRKTQIKVNPDGTGTETLVK